LIGRAAEVAALANLLATHDGRLVTLTGAGGTGKTRLAQAVATAVQDRYRDGACFVDLSPLTDPSHVPPAIATALGVREIAGETFLQTLSRSLRKRRLLLVLDNCERVLDAAADVAALLAACPDLVILATSRIPLHIRAERELAVTPLPLPDGKDLPSLRVLEHAPAIALFLERARVVSTGFSLTGDNAADVVAICQRLDGLPLAIELAAARVKSLTPSALLARLERRLPLLTGGARDLPARQRTLHDAIAWSYDLLTPHEQALFRQLAVFAGGWTLDAAEAVMDLNAEADLVDALSSLADKSLVWLDHRQSEPRYRMLETVREFAWDSLQQAGEGDQLRARHAAWVRALAEQMTSAFAHGPVTPYWPTRTAPEIDNVRAALTWVDATGDVDALVGLAGALGFFWFFCGYGPEGRRWVTHTLELPGGQDAPARQVALVSAATLLAVDDPDVAASYAREALRLAEQRGDVFGRGVSLFNLAELANARGAYAEAEQQVTRAMTAFDARREADWIAGLIHINAVAAYGRGELDLAQERFADSLARHRQIGETWLTAQALDGLARVALRRADYRQAAALLAESLPLHRQFPAQEATIAWLRPVAVLAVAMGATTEAIRLFTAGTALREEFGTLHQFPDLLERAEVEAATAAARAAVGEAAFVVACEEGRRLSVDEAVRLGERLLAEQVVLP
jgi:predicted ATPase